MALNKLRDILIYFTLHRKDRVGRTKLLKLAYLADVAAFRETGTTISGAQYISYDHGPWTADFYQALESISGLQERVSMTPFGDSEYAYSVDFSDYGFQHLNERELGILEQVNEKWGGTPLKAILRNVYSTAPYAGTAFGEAIDFARTAPRP